MARKQKPKFITNQDVSAFEIPFQPGDTTGSAFSLWLRTSDSSLSQSGAGHWKWSGDVGGRQIGFDWQSADSSLLVGILSQDFDGDFDYSGTGDSSGMAGAYSAPVRSEHLYLAWVPRNPEGVSWVNLWTAFGSGSGSARLTDSLTPSLGVRGKTRLDLNHFGVSLTPPRILDHIDLDLRAELTTASLRLYGGDVPGLRTEVRRQRFLVEPSTAPISLGAGQSLVISAEVGRRSDSTDATGLSVDAAGLPGGDGNELNLKMEYNHSRFSLELGSRTLELGQGDGGYEEEGFFVSLKLASRLDQRGLALSLQPSWGDTTSSSAQRLWSEGQLDSLVGQGGLDAAGQTQAEISYGLLSSLGGGGLLTPYGKLDTGRGASNATLGMRLELNRGLQLSLEHSGKYDSGFKGLDHGDSGALKLEAELRF